MVDTGEIHRRPLLKRIAELEAEWERLREDCTSVQLVLDDVRKDRDHHRETLQAWWNWASECMSPKEVAYQEAMLRDREPWMFNATQPES